jgi:predicted membrane-bound spermidine synthase
MSLASSRNRILFALFFISGFCGLLYQVVWVRLAFASFGIITPVISVVISVFMLGLALGSWAGGRAIAPLTRRTEHSAIYFYALTELLIGVGAFAVPRLFAAGETILLRLGEANSVSYLFFSAMAIALSIFPWCVFMGATFPLMMAYVREQDGAGEKSFSFLYLANVFGATFGALLTATVLVELLGFRHTLWVAGAANFSVAAIGVALGLRSRLPAAGAAGVAAVGASPAPVHDIPWVQTILFTTGLASLAMEVVWTRSFTPVMGTQVYAFAALLVVYLIGTWLGSFWYRRALARGRVRPIAQLLVGLAVVSLLPIVLNDPRLIQSTNARIFFALLSIFPLCAALGYLTPRLIDDYAAGNPRIAGRAYALNVLGCILGPLAASYVLLPLLGANGSLAVLALPFLIFGLAYRREISTGLRWIAGTLAAAFLLSALFVNASYENPCVTGGERCEIRRDYAATVVSQGEGKERGLLVNGVGITALVPITKFMAHLPLAVRATRPESGLVICFGMGTTYRSLLSWDIRATAVELVPSVRDAFPYYHADARALLGNPKGRIVIDDGRRFLNRTSETYDVIVIDPPPPIEAAGSSLLYSKEFHEAVKRHLKPGGIFQSWFPGGEENIEFAIARSLVEVFPYVRAYRSVDGTGVHYLASMTPFQTPSVEEMVSRMPAPGQEDLAEWTRKDLRSDIAAVLGNEIPIASLLGPDPSVEVTDDRPYNEYFLLRRSTHVTKALY